jgi:hypothetical protein
LINGCSQAISAIIQIGPSLEEKDSGEYFGNKNATVSKNFVKENLFYQIITSFSTIYYYPQYYQLLRSNYLGRFIEIVFVFLPYVIIRPFFPKTLLRDAANNGDKVATEDHKLFFKISTFMIKFAVLFGKHYIGFFINTVRFLGGLSSQGEEKLLQLMMLANAGTISISIFLHTLKFKNKLSPKVAHSIYLMLVFSPFIAIVQLVPSCFIYWKMFIIFTIGLFVNFTPKTLNIVWTILVMILFVGYNEGYLPYAKSYIL